MASAEIPRDDLDGSLWADFYAEENEKPGIHTVLRNIIFRHNELVTEAGNSKGLYVIEPDDTVELSLYIAQTDDNEVKARIMRPGGYARHTVLIGYIDPTTNFPRIFPEYELTDEEQESINEETIRIKDEMVTNPRFATDVIVEYGNVDVQRLNRNHNDLLQEHGIFESLVDSINETISSEEAKIKIDPATTAQICIYSEWQGNTQIANQYLGIRILGAYHDENGYKQRHMAINKIIAKRDPELYEDGTSDMKFNPGCYFINDSDMKTITGLAQESIDLSCNLISEGYVFTTSGLGIVHKLNGNYKKQ